MGSLNAHRGTETEAKWTFADNCCNVDMKVVTSCATLSPETKAGCIILTENKRQSVKYHHREVQGCMFCWVINNVVHLEFMPTGATISSVRCIGTLQKLKAHIQRLCCDM
jgi:hypothetical protein